MMMMLLSLLNVARLFSFGLFFYILRSYFVRTMNTQLFFVVFCSVGFAVVCCWGLKTLLM